jgi:hypothetical protein
MIKQLREPSKTAIRQAMRHRLGYSYRQINECFDARLENIWYSVNGNCAIKWCNISEAEQELATMVANAMIRGEVIAEIKAAYITTVARKAAVDELLADLA